MQWIIERPDPLQIPLRRRNTKAGRREIERGVFLRHPQTKAIIYRFEVPTSITDPLQVGMYLLGKAMAFPAVEPISIVAKCDSILL